eukprot:TRINITY_DN1331_c0_g2_i1.p1 TRINITY_DN1331_c0_g2~~TRINITY_DN1331_c0_g2_i1.p1  ORF type:complete len:874 (+),score=133.54 TRINITY_DN1331_c0_g2_i1:103-2724(+)
MQQQDFGQPPGGAYGYGQPPPDQYGQPPPEQFASHAGNGAGAYDSQFASQYVDPMQSGMNAQYTDMPDYMRYTEHAGMATNSGGGGGRLNWGKIDAESGVAPRRCTDLVCVVIFFAWWIGILIFLTVVKNKEVDGRQYSDVKRLTHGMDYKARLCGVDPEVAESPYLFWCRNSATETDFSTAPTALNLRHPVCVSECPYMAAGAANETGPQQIECLLPESGTGPNGVIQPQPNIPTTQFGNVQNYFLMFLQKTAYTTPYNSSLLAGRYCIPLDRTLKESVLSSSGPLNLAQRSYKSIGSFQDCWEVLFVSTIVAIAMSFPYFYLVGSVKHLGKRLVTLTLTLIYLLIVVVGLFFLCAIFVSLENIWSSFPASWYTEKNIFYEREAQNDATIISTAIGAMLLLASFIPLGLIMNLSHEFEHTHELTFATWEAVMKMQSMLVVPPILAILKYFTMWALCSNLMTICAVGTFDDYRIRVEDQLWEGLSRNYSFDKTMIFGIVLYLYSAFWAMEFLTSLGQFIISYCGVLFYFTHKQDGDKVYLPRVALEAVEKAFRYHIGSIMLGSSWMWLFRIPRLWLYMKDESTLHKDSECVVPFTFCTCCVQSLGGCLDSCRGAKKTRSKSQDLHKAVDQWSKNAYNDVVVRAQHFLEATDKSWKYIHSHPLVKQYTGKCAPITISGVLWIGLMGAIVAYGIMAGAERYNDPSKDTFINDPFTVCVIAFILCGSIAYDFCALLDALADTLIYCFAFNKKFNRKTVYKFVPDNIRDIVGYEGIKDSTFGLYGQAKPDMYLSTWLRGGENAFQGWTKPPTADEYEKADKAAQAAALSQSGSGSRIGMPAANTGTVGYPFQTGSGFPQAGYPGGGTISGYPTAGYN